MAAHGMRAGLVMTALLVLGGCAFHRFSIVRQDRPERPPAPARTVNVPAKGDILLAGGITTALKSTATSEFYQQSSGTFLSAGTLPGSRAGTATAVTRGASPTVLVAGGAVLHGMIANGVLSYSGTDSFSAATFGATTGTFTATGKMFKPRLMATATALQNGGVLVTGGFDPLGTPVASAELYHPALGKFSFIKMPMHSPRAFHTATLLADGDVLIAGGMVDTIGTTTATAEIFDPKTETFTATANMPSAIAGHVAVLITGCACALEGQVYLADGFFSATNDGFDFDLSAGIGIMFDPKKGTMTQLSAGAHQARSFASATLLPGGKVLVAGGMAGDIFWSGKTVGGYSTNQVLSSAEIFDPTIPESNCVGANVPFTCNNVMGYARGAQAAALLTSGPNAGKVLLAGGVGAPATGGIPAPLATAELFDPEAMTFSPGNAMTVPRAFVPWVAVP